MAHKFGTHALWDYGRDGVIAAAATQYIEVPISRSGVIGLYIAWVDATSSATITLEWTSFGKEDAPVTTAGTYQWKDSGEVITGPAASAAGAAAVNLENVRQGRARLKVVAAANTSLIVCNGDHTV